MAAPLKRRDSKPVFYPDAFDKFHDGEIKRILDERGVKTVIVAGSATNVAVLYTATGAARIHRLVRERGFSTISNPKKETRRHRAGYGRHIAFSG